MRAIRAKTSSTFSPLSADVSMLTGIPDKLAQRAASCAGTARAGSGGSSIISSSQALAVLSKSSKLVPRLLLAELGGGGFGATERSHLFPTRTRVRFGEARARASARKVGSEVNEG